MLEIITKNIFLILEILAAVTGIIFLKKYRGTAAEYFIYFLIYIVVYVIIGKYSHFVKDNGPLSFLDGTLLERNYWLFTIFWDIGGTLFFGWYFHKILENESLKKVLRISIVVFLTISIIEIIMTLPDFFKTALPLLNVASLIIILQCVFYYFLEVLRSDKILYFYKSLGFYISCAILILWLIQTPLVFFEHYFSLKDADYVVLKNRINLIAISFMYLTYTIGLIVSNPDYD